MPEKRLQRCREAYRGDYQYGDAAPLGVELRAFRVRRAAQPERSFVEASRRGLEATDGIDFEWESWEKAMNYEPPDL